MSFYKRTAAAVFLLIIMPAAFLFAFGATEVPEIPPVTSGTQYLSPDGDGVQETASLTFKVKLYVKSDKGYVPEYGLRIIDPAGNTVAEKIEKEESDVFWLFQIFRGFDEFNLEKTIEWDGKDSAGKVLPDGSYNVQVWVKDATNNVTEISVDDFVIDTVKPSLSLRRPESMMFSPNNDGKKDVFIILQADGTVEAEWKGRILNESGAAVRSFAWTDSAPGDVLWDGTDDGGGFVENGTYKYEVSATDLAGNKSEIYRVEGIVLDSGAPELVLSADSSAFSPNGDGVKDTLKITPVYQMTEAAQSWSWSLAGSGGVVLEREGLAADGLPEEIVLDGLNGSGMPLFPGNYLFSMSVEYRNAWKPVAEQEIVLDITAPRVDVVPDRTAFSPNGDGLGDTLEIRFKSDEDVEWEGSIIDMTGEVVLETDSTRTTSLIKWNGLDAEGSGAPDGDYLVLGVFTDRAGNTTYAEPFTVHIDRRPVNTVLRVPSGFSPNGDGKDDVLKVAVDSDLYDDVREWKFVVVDDTGEILSSESGRGSLPRSLSWDGMIKQEGNYAPVLDGMYQARLFVDYEKGDFLTVDSDLFVVDVKPPVIDMVVSAKPFAKTDQGLEGSVFISVDVKDDREIRDWEMDVYNDKGVLVRTYAGRGNPSGDISWNTAENGIKLDDGGLFTIDLKVQDNGGNLTSFRKEVPLDVLLVKKDGKYFIMVPNIIFGAYRYTLDSAGPAMEKQNMESLKRIVELSERFPEYGLILDAHALNIYIDGPREEKEEEILYPLTENRAAEVKKALVKLGMDPDRISTEAFGGQFPMVSVTDRNVRWKNRRVEFAVSGLE